MVADPNKLLALTCRLCQQRLADQATMGVIAEHFRIEHPDSVDAKGEPKPELELVAYCTRDGERMEIGHTQDKGDFNLHTYGCSKCHRTYRMRQQK